MTTKEQRDEFEKAVYDWKSHDEWQFADTEACWKFMFNAGRASVIDSQQPASVDALEPVAYRLSNAIGGLAVMLRDAFEETQKLYADFPEALKVEPLYLHPPIAPADERTYEDGLLRAAEICREQAKDQHKLYVDGCIDCEEAIEQEAKGVNK